jgi:cold shock protein
MQTGKVRFWRPEKGYGFIVPDTGGVDLFCHVSELPDGIDDLPVGQRVRFEERPAKRKPGSFEATNVEVI